MKKITIVLGASTNPSRYSYLASYQLKKAGKDFIPVGIKSGKIADVPILNIKDHPNIVNVDTVTIYLSPINQAPYEDYILSLKPRRIIFNPGTENLAFSIKAQYSGIETVEACTLVMLSANTYDWATPIADFKLNLQPNQENIYFFF